MGTATGYHDAGSDDPLFRTLIRSVFVSARSDDQIGMDDRTPGPCALSKHPKTPGELGRDSRRQDATLPVGGILTPWARIDPGERMTARGKGSQGVNMSPSTRVLS